MSVYAQVCSRTLGRHLGQWRNDDFCPIQCPKGQIYSECGSLCPNTCQSPVSNMIDSYCTSECFPSCICPEGFLEHENQCIKRDECPCVHHKRWYNSNEKISVKCNECTCNGGSWQCSTDKCPGKCSILGHNSGRLLIYNSIFVHILYHIVYMSFRVILEVFRSNNL